jgi:hypothetical protein
MYFNISLFLENTPESYVSLYKEEIELLQHGPLTGTHSVTSGLNGVYSRGKQPRKNSKTCKRNKTKSPESWRSMASL